MYEIIESTIEKYKNPICCSCKKTATAGKTFSFKYYYGTAMHHSSYSEYEWIKDPGRGKAFLCRECMRRVIWKWRLFLILVILLLWPISGIINIFTGLGYHKIIFYLLAGLLLTFNLMVSHEKKCAGRVWKCIKESALAAGCQKSIGKYVLGGTGIDKE